MPVCVRPARLILLPDNDFRFFVDKLITKITKVISPDAATQTVTETSCGFGCIGTDILQFLSIDTLFFNNNVQWEK
jgi:hypothetical protein